MTAGPGRARWPLYAAGFTTAFGAHAVAANLGGFSADAVTSLLVLGGLLALYDGAEVLLKPVFGTLADRIGARPVLLGGLVAFAAASALYAVAGQPGLAVGGPARPGRRRLGVLPGGLGAGRPPEPGGQARQGPSARTGSTSPSATRLGPLLGGVLVWAGGLRLLFACMAVLAACGRRWPRRGAGRAAAAAAARQTVLDLARRLADPVVPRPDRRARRRPPPRCRSASASCRSRAPRRDSARVATGAAVSVLAAMRRRRPAAGRAGAGRRAADHAHRADRRPAGHRRGARGGDAARRARGAAGRGR